MTIPIKQVTEFVNYVDMFYGTNDPVYPMMHQGTKQPLNKYDITRATLNYIDKIQKGDLEYVHWTWGDGDSLDRERVRDILLDEYDYKYVPDSFNMSDMQWVNQYA
tara:strand:- start:861 stop:1178 length:318 start_codon:yes stop_codon:yes gene_type:complete